MPTLQRPDVLFLDVGDTLVAADPSWGEVYASAFPDFGVNVSQDDFRREFAASIGDWENGLGPFDTTEEASYARIREFDGRVFARLGYPDLPEAFFRRVEEAFMQRSAWLVFPDVLPALGALREAGVRLGVISNWTWGAPDLLHDLELAAQFETLVISSRVGYQKPHRAIFEHALEVMSVAPERALHVGDSPKADVAGARQAGIGAVLIARYSRELSHVHADRAVPEDVPTVTDLLELLDLVGVPRPVPAPAS